MEFDGKAVEEVIVLDRVNKPRFAVMQITDVPTDKNDSDTKGVAMVPFVRLWLLETEWLSEKAAKTGATYFLDIVYTTPHQIDDKILVFDGNEMSGFTLSDEEQIEIRNYLDGACSDAYGFDVVGLLEQSKLTMQQLYGKENEMKVHCKRCTFDFTPKPKTEKVGDLEAVIFECPTCHKKYIAAVSDSALRERIREWQKAMKDFSMKDRGDKENAFRTKMLERMRKENVARSRELCAEYIKLKQEESDNAEEETGSAAGSAGNDEG